MHTIEADDLQSEEDIGNSSVSCTPIKKGSSSYLSRAREKENKELFDRLESFGVLSGASEFYYYKHPNMERDYIRIQRHNIQFDWEQQTVAKGPMFFRTTLKLSQAMRRRLMIQEQLAIEKAHDVNPLELKPNFFGIGIDLAKFFRWASRWFKK